MLTIAEYAQSRSVSYEAVRKQIVRYSLELDGHISKQGRTQYLDETAERFLDSKREKDPVFVLDDRDHVLKEKEERISELEEQLRKITQQYQMEHAVAMLAEERQKLLADQQTQLQELTERHNKIQAEKDIAVQRSHDLEIQLLTAQKDKEIESERSKALEISVEMAEKTAKEKESQLQEASQTIERLRHRGIWARILNKD